MTETAYAKLVARNLRNIAIQNEKTQADIARDLKISKATISSWMNGTRIPRMEKIDLLCHYFNCKRADIMEEHTEQSKEWYYNQETAQIAQQIFEDSDMRILFDAARDSKPEDLQMAADLLKRLKGTNPNG